MGKNKIILTREELTVLEDFIRSVDTQSKQTKAHLMAVYKNFVTEVGLININDSESINNWIKNHEHGKPNNNCRYFLMKFAEYLNITDGPITKWKIKRVEANRNPLVFDEIVKNNIVNTALKIKTKHCKPLGFYYYLRLLDECALRKSEPLNSVYNDLVYRNEIPMLLIRGKGNRQRWAVLPASLYVDLIDYCKSNNIEGNDPLFSFNLSQVRTMYNQTCRIAKKDDMKRRGFDPKDHDKHNDYAVKVTYNFKNSKREKNSQFVPLYSLHKFRRFRIQQWHREGVSLVEIMYRAGHSSLEVTKIYINEGEDIYGSNWNDQINNVEDKILLSAMERYRDSLN